MSDNVKIIPQNFTTKNQKQKVVIGGSGVMRNPDSKLSN